MYQMTAKGEKYMGMLFKGVLALFWLVFVPMAAGIPFLRKKERYTITESFLTGYLFLFAAAESLILPMIYLKLPLHILVFIYGVLTGGMALWGCFCLKKKKNADFLSCQACESERSVDVHLRIRELVHGQSVYFWLALAMILFQILILVLFAHFDADDSFFVGAATTAVQTDTIFSVNPYTGIEYKSLPDRYVLSPFPVFLAVISQLSGGLHPAIMAHTVFPAIFLGMVYVIQYQLSEKWFHDDKKAKGTYLFFVALLCWFSAFSVYNAGNFQMVRIWQGKALLASAMLPLLAYFCISLILEEKQEYPWILLVMANISCCLISSMGIILAPLLMGLMILTGLIQRKNLVNAAKGICCMLPSIVLGVVYILIK